MRTGPYHHSVWFDVFAVLLVGAVLVGGAGYLLYQAGGAATGAAGGAAGPRATASSPPVAGSAPAQRPPPPVAGQSPAVPNPLRGRRSGSAGGTTAPFSETWRQQAEPDLTAPAPDGGVPGNAGGDTDAPSSPAIASSKPSGGAGIAPGGDEPSADWRTEAQKLSGRARALSRQLGKMDRDGRSKKKSERTSPSEEGSASTAGARTNDRDVPPPPNVPIGGAEWLAAAGAAYALNRLREETDDADDEE